MTQGNKYLEKVAAYTPEMVLAGGQGSAPASQFGRFASYKYPTHGTAAARTFMKQNLGQESTIATRRLDVNTRNMQRLDSTISMTPENIASAEQAARDARFNDVLGRHQAKVEGLRAAEEAASARAKKIGLGLGAAGLIGAGAYALHRHNQEKQAAYMPDMVQDQALKGPASSQLARFGSYNYPTLRTDRIRDAWKAGDFDKYHHDNMLGYQRNFQRLGRTVDLTSQSVDGAISDIRKAELISKAKKIGLGLGAAGLIGAGAYALHRHNQEKQASFGILARDTVGDIASKTPVGVLDDVSRYVKQMGNSGAEGKALNESAVVSALRRRNPIHRNSYNDLYNAPASHSYSDLRKIAETYSMPLSDAIKEHKDLTAVLRSNNRKDELKELKEQGEELRGMLSRAKAS